MALAVAVVLPGTRLVLAVKAQETVLLQVMVRTLSLTKVVAAAVVAVRRLLAVMVVRVS